MVEAVKSIVERYESIDNPAERALKIKDEANQCFKGKLGAQKKRLKYSQESVV